MLAPAGRGLGRASVPIRPPERGKLTATRTSVDERPTNQTNRAPGLRRRACIFCNAYTWGIWSSYLIASEREAAMHKLESIRGPCQERVEQAENTP